MLRPAAVAAALASALLLALPAAAQGQHADRTADDTKEVRAVIDRLFDAMRAGDSTAVRQAFAPQMRLMTVAAGEDSAVTVQATPPERFAAAVGAPREATWDERIWNVEIRRDGPLASAWVPYAFYVGDEMSHCGTNAFQLAGGGDMWQIVQITDTRRSDCDDFVPEWVRRQ
jgi:hypothetical protein